MRYLQLQPEQIGLGQQALLLCLTGGSLCAAALERRPDGRLRRFDPAPPGPTRLIATIGMLISRDSEQLLVVLEEDAYWPDCFPQLDKMC